MPVIEIPIRDSAEVVEVDLDDLAESDPQEIIQLLVDEQAPLALFPRFALAYWERGIVGAFEQVCQKGLGECDQRGKSSDSGSVRVHLAGLLAAHLLMQGEVQKATRLLNDAENVDAADETLWLRKAALMIIQSQGGDSSQAEQTLKQVINRKSDKQPPLLQAHAHQLLGFSLLQQSKWSDALGHLQQAFRQFGSALASPALRLAIGHCLFKLGQVERALQVFSTCKNIDVDVPMAECHLRLAQIHSSAEHMTQALSLLKQAYDRNRLSPNPHLLLHLATHFFYRKDLAKVRSLLQHIVSSSTCLPVIRAQAHLWTAKAWQAEGNFEEAQSHFLHSATLQPTLIAAQWGLAQCYLARGDLSLCRECVERCLATGKAFPEAQTLLALVNLACLSGDADLEEVRKVARLMPSASNDDLVKLAKYQVALLLGRLSDAYSLLKELIASDLDARLKQVLRANAGAIAIKLGHLNEAEAYLSTDGSVVTAFNRACLQEAQGNLEEAEAQFRAMSGFIPAQLRLGILLRQRGQLAEAMDHFKEAIGLDEQCVDAWQLMATVQWRQKALQPARKSLERILKRREGGGKEDALALTCLAMVHLEMGRHERKENRTLWFQKSFDVLSRVLSKHDRGDAVAMHAMAVMLAEEGHWQLAKDLWMEIRSNLRTFDVLVNLGHCFVELGHYPAAMEAYREASLTQPTQSQQRQLHLFMARALYLQGRAEEGKIEPFQQALEHLTAMEQEEDQAPLRYNRALILLSMVKHGGHDASLLPEARSIFESLSDAPQLDQRMVADRAQQCCDLAKHLDVTIRQRQQAEQQRLERLERLREEREAARQREAELQAEAAKASAERLAAIERQRQEMADKMRQINLESKRVRRRPAVDTATVSDDEEGEEEEEEPMVKRRKRRSSFNDNGLSKEFLSSSDEELFTSQPDPIPAEGATEETPTAMEEAPIESGVEDLE